MRRTASIATVVTLLATVTIACGTGMTAESPGLQGAWTATSWEVDGTTVADPQPGLIVFTETHYSMMYVDVPEARAQYAGEEMTDAEVIAAYGTLTANSGRYEVSGNELITRAFVAKDPNYMGSWPENAETYSFRLDGDTLSLQWPSDWPDARSGTFRRVEGEPVPW